jgi:hypothetical protein
MNLTSYSNSTWQYLKDFFLETTALSPGAAVTENAQFQFNTSPENEVGLSTMAFRLIWKKTKITSLFERAVADPRHGECTYSVSSLLSCGLLMYFLRCGSRNAFHNEKRASHIFTTNVAKAIHAPTISSPKTIENLFLQLNPEDLTSILPTLFQQLIRSKFFQLHPECTSNGRFLVAIDAFTTHIYHSDSQHPTDSCPYCLKRQRGNSVWFCHLEVCLSIITPNGLRFPLFFYRVKGAPKWGKLSAKKFKQESELSVLRPLLEQLHSFFPKSKFTILADSLYANYIIMELANKYHLDYDVVRKAGSLRSLNAEVDGLKKITKPLKNTIQEKGWQVEQTAYLIDDLSHKGYPFHLLDLQEERKKLPSKRFAKMTQKSSHWQWIFKGDIGLSNAFEKAHEARLRWHHEDQHNSLKNRGFAVSHDMSRAPHSQTIWKTLMFIAYFLSQLMEISRIGHFARRSMAICNWIADLWAEFAKVNPEFLWNLPLPGQLRFFFDTS